MNIDVICHKLPHDIRLKFNAAISESNIRQACNILRQAGMPVEAVDVAEGFNCLDEAIEYAIAARMLDRAEEIARKCTSQQKLADVLTLRGQFTEAAELYTVLGQYEKAAKLYFKNEQYDRAAVLYAKINQFMNAIMCYQISGNTQKQLEMQIRAFEHDLALANGDIMATNVSRTMAIQAAKQFILDPAKAPMAVDVLIKADALASTAEQLEKDEKFEAAAVCYEANGQLEKAQHNYVEAGNISNALRICQNLQDDSLEIDTLKRFGKYFRLGQKFLALKKFDDAIAALKHVDSTHPNYPDALELQGDIYCKQKIFSDAVLCYESLLWLELPPESICRVGYKAGYSYERLDDLDNALNNYQKVYDVNPNYKDITSVVASISSQIRRREAQDSPAVHHDNTGKPRRAPTFTTLDNPDPRYSLTNPPPQPGAAQPEPFLDPDQIRSSDPGQITPNTRAGRGRVSTYILEGKEIAAVGSDRYEVVEEVAHGGMGIVYKATDTLLMRTVALKVLATKLRDNAVALEYFMREARASAKLQHVNIVTIYDIGCLNDGNIYMATEFIDGKNLKQIITQTGAFPTKSIVQVGIHACRGLQYAHDNGIIHRDVKSSNMMIAKKDKTLKICDFGLAKFITEDRNSTQAIGTPYYMSPEQVLGNEIDCRSDIYSLGITLFELATGSLPFTKGDLPYMHVHEQPPIPSSINPDINPTLETIILRMLKKNPDDRFESCNAIISALKSVDYNK